MNAGVRDRGGLVRDQKNPAESIVPSSPGMFVEPFMAAKRVAGIVVLILALVVCEFICVGIIPVGLFSKLNHLLMNESESKGARGAQSVVIQGQAMRKVSTKVTHKQQRTKKRIQRETVLHV